MKVRRSRLRDLILLAALSLFSLPLLVPEFELWIIILQFGILFPLFLLLSVPDSSYIEIFYLFLYCSLILLLPFSLPGSFLGWMTMLCAGNYVGRYAINERTNILIKYRLFFLLAGLLPLYVIAKNYQSNFSHELLSDYFSTSSINTVPLLAVCSLNFYLGYYYYLKIAKPSDQIALHLLDKIILYILVAAAILSIVVFDFRSGILSFLILAAVLITLDGFRSLALKLVKNTILLMIFLAILLSSVGFFAEILVPGRTDLTAVFSELAVGSLRMDRLIQFWQIAGGNGIALGSWSAYLSFSGMSDFVAGLFPLSILFLLPPLWLMSLAKYAFKRVSLYASVVFLCAMSSLAISLLQPDFYSMFTFFALSSLVFYGEGPFRSSSCNTRSTSVGNRQHSVGSV